MAAGMTPLQAHNALAAARDGGSGGGGGVGAGSAGGGGDASRVTSGPAKVQPGLVRAEDNPDGRRMRAVFMGANDIVGTLQARLLSLGMFRSLGNQRRQARTGGKLLFLGLCMRAIRAKAQSRRTTKLFAAGLFDCLLLKQRARARLALQFFTLGQLRLWFRRRQAVMRATLTFAAGLCMRLHFKRRIGIFAKAMFALGLGPMMKVRVKPRGPSPGGSRLLPPLVFFAALQRQPATLQVWTEAARPQGPGQAGPSPAVGRPARREGDALGDAAQRHICTQEVRRRLCGAAVSPLLSMLSPLLLLARLFPDMKDVFTVKVISASAATLTPICRRSTPCPPPSPSAARREEVRGEGRRGGRRRQAQEGRRHHLHRRL